MRPSRSTITELDEELAEFVDTDLRIPQQRTRLMRRMEDELELNTGYRFYLDHHMPIILNKETGPLRGCTALAHGIIKTDQWKYPESEVAK